jgi:hypothetical protein
LIHIWTEKVESSWPHVNLVFEHKKGAGGPPVQEH